MGGLKVRTKVKPVKDVYGQDGVSWCGRVRRKVAGRRMGVADARLGSGLVQSTSMSMRAS